ncbi:MAG: tyrosine-type recombinase/integrase [Clostridiales bacterium]|nr:tyrosine-type recombinase/integrase [Clostridiales bacterium]
MSEYSVEKTKKYTLKLRELIKVLPPCCADFFRGIELTTGIMTRYGYAVDLKTFFTYLLDTDICKGADSMRDIDYSVLEKVDSVLIECYLEYVSLYQPDEDSDMKINGERAKARKLSAIRALFKYLYKKERIKNNAPALVDTPKLHEKPIIRLEPDEMDRLLSTVASGSGLTKKQKEFHQQNAVRDTAIITLFLGTGMRISELVGIDVDDLNFMSNEVRVTRKGGNEEQLVFGSDVRKALLEYMVYRESVVPAEGHEKALFLSMQKKRMTVRSVELLVKKYAQIAAPLKKISPHKLRSTYGTMLYRETGDIYLVADVLGHKDVNTTRKHYAAMSEDRRRFAAEVIKLHPSEDNAEPVSPAVSDKNKDKTE